MCPLKVCLVKQSVSKRQKKIPHSPILLRIDWKVPLNRRILTPGWAGPLRQFSQELEGCSGHRRQMELERTNSCDKSGNGWCICPPLWGKNHRWKELIKANKKNPCRQSWAFYLCFPSYWEGTSPPRWEEYGLWNQARIWKLTPLFLCVGETSSPFINVSGNFSCISHSGGKATPWWGSWAR